MHATVKPLDEDPGDGSSGDFRTSWPIFPTPVALDDGA
jgi:hypothetical protein